MTMTDPYDNRDDPDFDPDDPDALADGGKQTPKNLRDAKERSDKRAKQLERENAVLKAGIDTTTPVGAMFLDAYKGDLTTEKIREEAAAVGAWKDPAAVEAEAPPEPTPAPTTPAPTDDQRAFTTERQALATGSAADTGIDEDPYVKAERVNKGVLERGGTREDALAMGIHEVLTAGAAGDQRVIVNRTNE